MEPKIITPAATLKDWKMYTPKTIKRVHYNQGRSVTLPQGDITDLRRCSGLEVASLSYKPKVVGSFLAAVNRFPVDAKIIGMHEI
ncbi:hypothetical protein TNCV_4763241 [Trichonephila clavipes]|nr:hypothetical protein TNCV_4763241 [Trichonephila clavipes]